MQRSGKIVSRTTGKDVKQKLTKQENEQKLLLSVRVILQRSGKIVSRTTGKKREAEAYQTGD